MSASIAVILPTKNEAEWIVATLNSIGHHEDVEVIVCDGGSEDDTVSQAETWGACVVTSAAGRAIQMNTGAQSAQAETFLFLHADTVLPEHWKDAVQRVLASPEQVGGAFAFGCDWNTPIMRLYARMINLRSRWMQRPYGDQGIFLRAETFRELGGYPEWPIMEDVELIRRLRKQGRIAIIDTPVITSARRWRELGPRGIFLRNQRCLMAYRLGVSVETIAKWYRK